MAEAATQAMLLKPVVYCDQQKQPIVLSALPAPDSVKTFAQHLEHETGQKPQLLSYWNYSHKRYDALQSIDQLRQDEALLVRGSHNEVSNSAATVTSTSTTTTTTTTMPMYRAQLWLETTWLRTTPVDPDKDSEEFAELERHVRRCGRRGPGGQLHYKLTKAVRVHYTYLARQFDETRQTKLHGYQNRIKLLYYTANAWTVGQVLEHGFVMQDELPSVASPLVANHSAEVNAVLAMSHANTTAVSMPAHAHETNTLRHPFLFTSHPLPRNNDNNAVVVDVGSPDREHRNALLLLLLCEVAPGRQWRSEQPLQSITSDGDTRDVVESHEQPPAGYDSVVYEEHSVGTDTGRHGSPHRRHRSGSTASSQAAPRLPPSVLQVQTSMSHQALPRYLLTLEVDTTPVRSHSNTVRVAGNKGEETHVGGATTSSRAIVVADDRIELGQSTPLRRHASRPRSVHSTHVRRSRSLTNAPNNDTNANHHVSGEGQRRAASATRRVRSARAVGHDEQQQLLLPRQHVQVVRPSTVGQPAAHIAQQQHIMVPTAALRSSSGDIVMPVQKPPLMPVMAPSVVVPAAVRPIPQQQQPQQMMLETSAASMRERLLAPAVLQCALHPRRMTTLYCSTCSELICPYCASVGTHQGHAICAADEQAAQMQGIVQEVCRELREGRDQVERVARQLTLERADAVQRQGRRVQSLRLLLNEVRRAIDERESILTRQLATQEAGLQAPVDSIDHVRTSYAEVLQPLETALKDYFAALQRVATGPPCGGGTSMTLRSSVGQGGTYNAVSATSITQNEAAVGGDTTNTAAHQARVALLLFLRNAPHLLEQARIFLRLRAQDNVEGGLRDAIASVRAANRRAEQMLEHVKVSELRRQIESLGDAPALAAQKPRSALLASSTMNASSEALNEAENVPRLLRRNSMKSLASNAVSPSALMATTTISPSQRAALEEMRTMSGLERCLVDLQRGFIWTIQDATKLFAPGQTRTVCSTPFQLLRTSWELRIAALPKSDLASDFSSHFNGRSDDKATPIKGTNGTGHLSELSGTNGEADSTNTRSPARATDGQPFAAGRGVSLSAIQTSLPATNTNSAASDEEQWLGLFLCPKEHGMRMDFRVIAFSEVVWREWNVTGWSEAFVGKGWGLYPFLRRKDLMRTDKLARDNTVKLCITPISELY